MFALIEKNTKKVIYVSNDCAYDFDKEKLEILEIKNKTREKWLQENNLPAEDFMEKLYFKNIIHN